MAELVREFDDLAAGCEVVCHNDQSPRNTIYQDLGDGFRPAAFIDWGRRRARQALSS